MNPKEKPEAIENRRQRIKERIVEIRDDENANASNMVTGVIGICIALGAVVYMLLPTVTDAKAATGLSDGQKAMIGFLLFIGIAAIVVVGWRMMTGSAGGGGRRGRRAF